jgi:type IV pilus assembly protein PilF
MIARSARAPWRPFGGARLAMAIGVAAGLLSLLSCKTTTTYTTASESAQSDAPKVESDPHKRAAVRLQLATGYYQKGQLETAIQEANDAAQIDPGLAAAYGLLGLIYMDLDQKAKAEASFQRALQIDAVDPELNNNYGWFLCRNRREAEAVKYFDHAADNRLYATPAMALQNAGMCLLQVGDRDRAEKYLLRAFEADASSPIAKYQLARLYLGARKIARAEFYYDLLVKSVDPNAETLWLGVRIAHAKADSRTEQRLGDELRHRFPGAPETGRLNRDAFDE